MLTSNPLVESWGHFPRSRTRLLDLLHRTNPAGLVMLSGDVHHAELASGWRASPAADVDADASGGAAGAVQARGVLDGGALAAVPSLWPVVAVVVAFSFFDLPTPFTVV